MDNESPEQQEQSQVSEILQAWKDLGEELFADGEIITVPKLVTVRSKAQLLAIEIALTKHNGNISQAAKALDTSRRALRDKLKLANRYPWHPLWALELSAL